MPFVTEIPESMKKTDRGFYEQWGQRLGVALDDYGGALLGIVGTFLVGWGACYLDRVGALFAAWRGGAPGLLGDWMSILPLAGLGCMVFGFLAEHRYRSRWRTKLAAAESRRASLEGLEAQGQALYRDLLRGQLAILADAAELQHDARVSLYRHVRDGESAGPGRFELLARYSLNPNLARTGRISYPEDEGCLGRAWEEERFATGNLPDPAEHRMEYRREQEALGLPWSSVDKLTMKSRSYVARRINRPGDPAQGLAVVVFESEDPILDADRLQDLIDEAESSGLGHVVHFAREFEAKATFPKQRGF